MQSLKICLALAVCATWVSSAYAAEEVTLAVTGRVIPGACTVSLLEPNVDFGTIRAEQLNEDTMTELNPIHISYTTTCPSARAVGLSWVDNKAGTAYVTGEENFGLGEHNGKKIGMLRVLPLAPRRWAIPSLSLR